MNKTFCVLTLGCKVNQYESQVISEGLIRAGFTQGVPEKSGVVIINTCTVTAQSDSKSRRIIRKLKNINPGSILIVTGCGTEKHKKYFVDNGLIFASDIEFNGRFGKIIEEINRISGLREDLAVIDQDYIHHAGISGFGSHTRCFIKVQDGCDSLCSYCTIPLVRGRSRSRRMQDVVTEINNVVSNGYREVVLTGVHLGQYNDSGVNAVGLIRNVLKNDKLSRIRISSIEPQDIDDGFIDLFAGDQRLMPHLHLPIQSGSDTVLRYMNRRYTVDKYKEITAKLRETKKDLLLSTDLIVGFAGETEEYFEESLKTVLDIGFSKVHVFPFSPRPGTQAFLLDAKLPRKEIKRRVSYAVKQTTEKSNQIKKEFIGRRFDILVESKKWLSDNCWTGFTPNYLQVCFIDNRGNLNNTFANVEIDSVNGDHLYGKVINKNGIEPAVKQ